MAGPSGRGLTDRKIILAVVIGCVGGLLFSLFTIKPSGSSVRRASSDALGALETKLLSLNEKRESYEKLAGEAREKVKELEAERSKLSQLEKEATEERDRIMTELESTGGTGVSVKVGPPGTAKGQRFGAAVAVDSSINPKLASALIKVARVKEVLVIFADRSKRGELELCLKSMKKAGIASFIVVAFDKSIKDTCTQHSVPVFLHTAESNAHDTHAFARRKFALLRDFIILGYRVLVADTDVVFLQNPFAMLSRDADVEAMSSQGTDSRAYGEGAWIDDPSMGWARYAVTSRIFFLDSGLFFLQCTAGTIELVDRVAARLVPSYNGTAEIAFNEEIFLPSHTGYNGLHVSRRVLDYNRFVHPRYILKGPGKGVLKASDTVLVHVNTENDKEDFMAAVLEFAEKGQANVFSRFNWT